MTEFNIGDRVRTGGNDDYTGSYGTVHDFDWNDVPCFIGVLIDGEHPDWDGLAWYEPAELKLLKAAYADETTILPESSGYEVSDAAEPEAEPELNTAITFSYAHVDDGEFNEAEFTLTGNKANDLVEVLKSFRLFLNAAGFTYVGGLVATDGFMADIAAV